MCLVHEALGINLEEFQELVPNCTFEADLVRQSLRSILRALHFLHTEAGIVHTGQFNLPCNVLPSNCITKDIQPKNILLGTLDD
jgi:non-specific serine/threonine protein kinase